MRLGIFTDSHYSSQAVTCGNRYNSRSLEKIRQAYADFEQAGCDLVICLGDLSDREGDHSKELLNLRQLAQVIQSSFIPTVCLMGNHDAFTYTQEEFYAILGGCRPVTVCAAGKTLLFLDACYFKSGRHYLPGDSDWKDTFFPHAGWLKQALEEADGDVYLFVHQNLDPDIRADHRLHNADAINEMLLKSGKVRAVFQGHYHEGNQSIHSKIPYTTFPALCERENTWFVITI